MINPSIEEMKLTYLYLLKVVKAPVTTEDIWRFSMDEDRITYFDCIQALLDLTENQFIASMADRTFPKYAITARGEEALAYFGTKIRPSLRNAADVFAQELSGVMQQGDEVFAQVIQSRDGEYIVTGKLQDAEYSLLSWSFKAPNLQQAHSIQKQWIARAADVYAYIIRVMGEEEE